MDVCMFYKFTAVYCARILSGWSEWAFITPRPLKNKLELPFDDDLEEDEENGEDDVDDSHCIVYFGIELEFLGC